MTRRKIAVVVLATALIAVFGTAATRLVEGLGAAADVKAPRTQNLPADSGPLRADDLSPTITTTPLTEAERVVLARVGASLSDGPTVLAESDPDPAVLPSARSVNRLTSLPPDWAVAFVQATTALEALGTPHPQRSAELQPRVSNELYTSWRNALSATRSPGTFVLTRLSLGTGTGARSDAIPVAGAGWYTQGTTRTRFVVTATVSRLRTGWVITKADYISLGAGA